MNLQETIQKVPTPVWIVGGVGVVGLAVLLTKGGGGSTTLPGLGQSSDLTDALSGLQDQLGELGGVNTPNSGTGTGTPGSPEVHNNPPISSPGGAVVTTPKLPIIQSSLTERIMGTARSLTASLPYINAPEAPIISPQPTTPTVNYQQPIVSVTGVRVGATVPQQQPITQTNATRILSPSSSQTSVSSTPLASGTTLRVGGTRR
jgi:hypothetical protein